ATWGRLPARAGPAASTRSPRTPPDPRPSPLLAPWTWTSRDGSAAWTRSPRCAPGTATRRRRKPRTSRSRASAARSRSPLRPPARSSRPSRPTGSSGSEPRSGSQGRVAAAARRQAGLVAGLGGEGLVFDQVVLEAFGTAATMSGVPGCAGVARTGFFLEQTAWCSRRSTLCSLHLMLTGTRGVRRRRPVLPMFPGVLVSDALTGQAVSVTRLRQSADSLMTLVPYRQGHAGGGWVAWAASVSSRGRHNAG